MGGMAVICKFTMQCHVYLDVKKVSLFIIIKNLTYSRQCLHCSGFPVWLRDIPGIVFRTDNEPFKVFSTHASSLHHEFLKQIYTFCSDTLYCVTLMVLD